MQDQLIAPRSTRFPSRYKRNIDFLNPSPDEILVADIAAGLGKTCRFGGQIPEFYSVAQHSVIVSRLCPPRLRLMGLFHDGSEAYTGDIIKPLKNIIAEAFGPVEERLERVIFEKLGLDYEDLAAVKQYDLEAYDAEHAYLRKGDLMAWQAINGKINLSSDMWLPLRAESMFLKEFTAITGLNALDDV